MQETMTIAEYNKLVGKSHKQATTPAKPKKQPDLIVRLDAILAPYGWTCGLYRAFCLDERNPQTTNNEGTYNGVFVKRIGTEYHLPRTAHLGWLWDVQDWTEQDVVARLQEIEEGKVWA